jgi:hypothetical protein
MFDNDRFLYQSLDSISLLLKFDIYFVYRYSVNVFG